MQDVESLQINTIVSPDLGRRKRYTIEILIPVIVV